jgi:putative protease
LKEIAQIRAAVSPAVELEFFVHGALCVSYSGQCYLSEALCGRSANRGACVQACRSRYNVFDGQGREILHDKAVLSLKDYSLLDRLEDLLSVGISSFKIEGRLKNESYVRNVVAAYSRALDACIARHPEKYVRASYGRSQAGFQPDIQRTFHRSYTDLYLRGEKGAWAAMDIPKGMGAYVGSLLEIGRGPSGRSSGGSSGRSSAANSYIRLTSIPAAVQFAAGDGLSYVASNGDVEGFRIDNVQGDKLFCRVPSTLYKGARLYRNLDFAFEKQLASATSGRLLAVELSLECHLQDSDTATPNFEREETWMLKASARSEDGREAFCEKVFAAPLAQNQERMRGLIEAQLSKQTDIYRCRFVPSVFADFSQDASSAGAFPQDASSQRLLPLLSASTLNSIRRELCEKLDAQPCRALPLYKASEVGKIPLRDTSYKSNIANHKAFAQSLLVSTSPSVVPTASVPSAASSTAASSASASSAASASGPASSAVPSLQAFELCHQGDAELMRTRYCLRHELGICPRQQQTGASSAPLYLENNGRRFRLDFDCRNCEMILRSEDPKSGINEKL